MSISPLHRSVSLFSEVRLMASVDTTPRWQEISTAATGNPLATASISSIVGTDGIFHLVWSIPKKKIHLPSD